MNKVERMYADGMPRQEIRNELMSMYIEIGMHGFEQYVEQSLKGSELDHRQKEALREDSAYIKEVVKRYPKTVHLAQKALKTAKEEGMHHG